MMVFANGRPRGASPSQSYPPGSTTTLLSAAATLSPGRRDAGHKGVPIMVGAVRTRVEVDNARRVRGVRSVEQQQLGRRTVFGEHAEIGAARDQRRAEREALATLAPASGRAIGL